MQRVAALGESLTQAGVGPSEATAPRVGLLCRNGPEYVLLALAILRQGGCLVPVAGELTEPERQQLIETTRPHSLLIGSGFRWDEASGQSTPLNLDGMDAAARLDVNAAFDNEPAFDEIELARRRPAFIRFSSGKTGQSKEIILSYQRLLERIEAANHALRVTPQDRGLWMLPMAHHFTVSMMLYLTHGATTVMVDRHLGSDVLAAARRHGGTVVYAAPYHHKLLAAEASGQPWPT
jgi:long-chain acyl-CoA synthetase